jgi:hypothetical protein
MKPLRTRIVPGAGPGSQHIAGIQEALPPGERLLWQGAPDWRALALQALHLRGLALYFGALLALRLAASMRDGATFTHALGSALPLALLAAVALGLLTLYAWAAARTTIYAVTTRRVVLRVGVALPIVINLPFTGIESVALRRRGGGYGDLPFTLRDDVRLAWLHLWPHVRPWRLARAQPMLRAVPRAVEVAQVLAEALQAAAADGAEAVAPPVASPTAQRPSAALESAPMAA